MLKPDWFSCSQKIQLKRDPPVLSKLTIEEKAEVWGVHGSLQSQGQSLAKAAVSAITQAFPWIQSHMLQPSVLFPLKQVYQVTTTPVTLEPLSELNLPPMQTPWPSFMETGPVQAPFSDPTSELGDDMSLVISQCSKLSD